MAFVTVHELLHIAAGHWFGIGGHFTSLTSADADPAQTQAATATARAWMAGVAPLFTGVAGICALRVAPWARRRDHDIAATALGWIAVFGIPYIGVQLMTLGGPAAGVDTAAVLVGYFGIGGLARGVLSVAGVAFTIATGFLLGAGLGDPRPMSFAAFDAVTSISAKRRVVGTTFAILSICLIAVGGALLARPGRGNAMGPFLLADILWAVGMLTATPWRQPGPRFVRDVWLAPAIAAMSLLTLVGTVFPSDYAAAGLFFLPQLATAAYAARNRAFTETAHPMKREGLGIAARAV